MRTHNVVKPGTQRKTVKKTTGKFAKAKKPSVKGSPATLKPHQKNPKTPISRQVQKGHVNKAKSISRSKSKPKGTGYISYA